MAHTTQRLWSLRVGDWRVIFALRDDELWILKIGQSSKDVHLPAVTGQPDSRTS